ncbi:hypothetical protein GCM10009039_24260 [Halocalculus aciditolerans]|uniref:Uncharacterized protein n=1 Tax=Halocalculus aciditolerans TaxID=1383812 RepID=A0A830FLW1_9EURY|nr:hypothetical protein GCM10009039_24260 [Halocalculus aciditolerans]
MNTDRNREIATKDVCNAEEHSQPTGHEAKYFPTGGVSEVKEYRRNQHSDASGHTPWDS